MEDITPSHSSKDSKGSSFIHYQMSSLASIGMLLLMCLGLLLQNVRLLRDVRLLRKQYARLSALNIEPAKRPPVSTVSVNPATTQNPTAPQMPEAAPTPQRNASIFIDAFPKYPLMVRGISLYVLWQAVLPQPAITLQMPTTFLQRSLVLGAWPTTEIFQRPAIGSSDEPWLPAQEALNTFTQLLQTLLTLSTANQPAYVILHVREFSTAMPHASLRLHKKEIRQAHVSRQKLFVESLQDLVRTHMKPISREPQAFGHFDRQEKRRGWLVFTSIWALLCNVDSAQARVLADIIQPQEISTEHGGIAFEHYDEVLRRVGQWNSTQDFFEAVTRLEELATGSEISTRGQLWLNFSLALIAILLAIVGIGSFGLPLVAALGLFAVASLLFAWYASKGFRFLLVFGVLCFLAAIAVAVIFAPLWFPALQPHPQAPPK